MTSGGGVGPTAVEGVRVGHRTADGTGVTVVLPPAETVGAAEVRGGAPATREIVLLEPGRTVAHVDAVVCTGGSVFGLSAADGVVRFLAERGRGHPTGAGPVPIVPTLGIFDLGRGDGPPPGPEDGYAAALAAEEGTRPASGRVGAGTGALVGAWRGGDYVAPGGVGFAEATVDEATLGVLAVVNAAGDVLAADGSVLAGSSAPADTPGFPEEVAVVARADDAGRRAHTTLVVLATDAALDKAACHLVAQSAHDGLARALRPSHTRFDGDAAVVLATGAVEAHLDRVRVASTDATAVAIRDAVSTDGRNRAEDA